MPYKAVRKYNAIWFADPNAASGYGYFELELADGTNVDTLNYSVADLSAILVMLGNGGTVLYNEQKNSFIKENFRPPQRLA